MPRRTLALPLALSLVAACRLPGGLPGPKAPTGEPAAATPAAEAPQARDDEAIRAAVAAADRTDADRQLDAGRKPAELFSFIGLRPGMRVAELAAGGGYTTELLARVVGDSGVVYGQNPRLILQRFAEKPWKERLARPVNKGVIRVDREMEYPFPPDAQDLDAVVIVLFYHDLVWMEVDRERMNRSVFEKLKPGGVYAVVDHSAKEGAGTKDVKTLHRIEESVVKAEVEHAGFTLSKSGDFLRNPDDKRDWNDSPREAGARRGTSDRFVLVFTKPK